MASTPSNVSRVVWPREAGSSGRESELRRAAMIQAAVLALVGAWLRFGWGHATVAHIVWGLAAVALLTGLIRPAWFRPLRRFGDFLARIVGTILTWLLLAPLYLIGFGFSALVLRFKGADPMQREPLPEGLSYWIRRSRSGETDDYHKQFRVEDLSARSERRPLTDDDGETRP